MQIRYLIVGCVLAALAGCEGEVDGPGESGAAGAMGPSDPMTQPDSSVAGADGASGASSAGGASGMGGAGAGTSGTGGQGGTTGSAGADAALADDAGLPDAEVDPDAGPIISDGPAEVRFVGRVDRSDANGPRFAWSGTGLVARFRGTSVAIELGGGQEYTVLIDGMLRPKLVPGSGETMIADDLEEGEHEIELYRRTEASQGESQFRGFTFAGGGMLLPPAVAPARRIEVIGDSITCGYGNEGADESCGFTPQTENHYQTYAAIAARAVGAELSTIAWSGRGMVCNYGDDAQSCSMPMPTFYDRTLPNSGSSQWSFDDYVPQVVIINLGTNDFSTSSDPSQFEFTSAYTSFLRHVRSKYPDALILCTCGPLLWGEELDMVRGYIEDAVDATGDDNVDTFEIPSQSADDGLGCGYHPSIKTHQKMADLVREELQAHLGW